MKKYIFFIIWAFLVSMLIPLYYYIFHLPIPNEEKWSSTLGGVTAIWIFIAIPLAAFIEEKTKILFDEFRA